MKTTPIQNILDLIEEEFGPEWQRCPFAQRLGAVSLSVFDESTIIKQVPFTWVDHVLEFKHEGTFGGKPLSADFATLFLKKFIRGPELEYEQDD